MSEEPLRYYYYANERGCMKDLEAIDEIGVGVNDGRRSCSLRIRLIHLQNSHEGAHRFTMEISVHSDEWRVLSVCRDALDLLSNQGVPSGELHGSEPFYALRKHFELLGYTNLGILVH